MVYISNGASNTDGKAGMLPVSSDKERSKFEDGIIAKLNWRVTLCCALICLFAFIDRGNLGFAASQICDKLHMSHSQYGLGAGLFYAGYVLSQIPSNMLLTHFGATRWLGFLMVSWGVVATSMSFVHNTFQFYVIRFLLGLSEGGCFPGIWYYISTFFPNAWISVPMGLIHAAVPLSQLISAPLAAGLLSLHGMFGLDGWRLLFFTEGLLTVVFGMSIPWMLPKTPENLTCLTEDEKLVLKAKMKDVCHEAPISLVDQIRSVLQNVTLWFTTLAHFMHGAFGVSLMYFSTLIVNDMLNEEEHDNHHKDTCASSMSTNILAVTLTVVPFSLCAGISLYVGYISHRVKDRPKTAGAIYFLISVFVVLWVWFRKVSFTLSFLSFSLAIGLKIAPFCFFMSLLMASMTPETKAFSLAVFNSLSNVGGILGPIFLGLIIDQHGYVVGMTTLALLPLLAALALQFIEDPLVPNLPNLSKAYQ